MSDPRTLWHSCDLGVENKPFIVSLLRYRQSKNRHIALPDEQPNLVSSKTLSGKQMPILDLDFSAQLVKSSTPGHFHLYLNQEMSRPRWALLMLVLWYAGVVEKGFAVWSLRRGANFVRLPEVTKQEGKETVKPEYGWVFKKRNKP